jgi:hypothetical protein
MRLNLNLDRWPPQVLLGRSLCASEGTAEPPWRGFPSSFVFYAPISLFLFQRAQQVRLKSEFPLPSSGPQSTLKLLLRFNLN